MLRKLVAGVGCALMAAGLAAGAALAAVAPSARVPSPAEETCEEVGQGEPTGKLHKTTVPPDGSEVEPASPIEVTLEWDASALEGALLHKALDCVWVDGRLVPQLSVEQRNAPNDGRFLHRYVVPADLPAGSKVCDRGFVSGGMTGDTFSRHKSKEVCFTVKPPLPATVPAPLTPAPLTPAPLTPAPPDRPAEPVPDASRATLGAPETPEPTPAPPLQAAPAVTPAPPAPPAPRSPLQPVLPQTGGRGRPLLVAAGADLAFAGLALIAGARRRLHCSSR